MKEIKHVNLSTKHYLSYSRSKKVIELTDSLGNLFNACMEVPWVIDDDDPRLKGKTNVREDDRRTLAGQILVSSLKSVYQQV